MLQIYRILEVEPGADFETIKKSYRRLLKLYHPDVNKGQNALNQFHRIRKAFENLQKQLSQPGETGTSATEDSFLTKLRSVHRQYTLGKSFLHQNDSKKRIEIINQLVASRKKAAYTFIRRGLWDDDEKVVACAIAAVGQLNIMQSGSELAALYLRSSVKIRMIILETLENMANIKAFNSLLIVAMKDAQKSLKKKALLLFTKKYFS
ncbi:MAG: J domain-containing protein [Spirochaetales bacterium]|nr:J domain-containing protein [Spirochaetales bacterium]